MSVKHFKLGWRRCHLIECTSALTIEQSEEDCGWVHWREHKDEIARLKAEVERLRASSFVTAVPSEEYDKLKSDLRNCYTAIRVKDEEKARLKAEVERLRKAEEWKPIATAPKDMSQVLGYVEESVVVMWWFTYSNNYACWETVDGESEVDPTHWMHLPIAPAKDGQPSV